MDTKTKEIEVILLPEYITKALADAVVAQCKKLRTNDPKVIRHYAEFAEDVAQRIHKAMIKQ